jgi:periplasmic copper chaperone A
MLLLVVASCADDADDGTPELQVRGVTIALPAGQNTAIYFDVENTGPVGDRLVEVRSAAGTSAELHETRAGDDGLMRMHHVDHVEVPAGASVRFEPGGLHVMVYGAAELELGQVVPVELVFERSGTITVDAVVQPYIEVVDG